MRQTLVRKTKNEEKKKAERVGSYRLRHKPVAVGRQSRKEKERRRGEEEKKKRKERKRTPTVFIATPSFVLKDPRRAAREEKSDRALGERGRGEAKSLTSCSPPPRVSSLSLLLNTPPLSPPTPPSRFGGVKVKVG